VTGLLDAARFSAWILLLQMPTRCAREIAEGTLALDDCLLTRVICQIARGLSHSPMCKDFTPIGRYMDCMVMGV
jgi:hypothetical protein